MRLQSKLGLSMAAAASVAIFLMASAFWVLAAREQRRSVDDFLLGRVEQIRGVSGDTQPGRAPRGNGPRNVFDQDVSLRFRFVRPDGEVVVDDGLPPVVADRVPRFSTVEIDDNRYRMVATLAGVDGREATVQVAQNVEDSERGLDRLKQRIIVGSVLGIATAGLFGALMAKRLSTPIRQVSDAAREMAVRPDLPNRIDIDRNDEVGDLATSFNQMLGALEASRDQQRRLVADASHELRTPLTSLRLKIDLLDRTPDLPTSQRQELLAGSAVELERLTDLVAELVELATDPSGVSEEVADVDLRQVAVEVAERFVRTTGRRVIVDAHPSFVMARENMVSRAISNLIDNAVKYSPSDTTIEVTVGDGRVEVTDHGEGIAEVDLGFVFDRFYRSPTARTRPGNGIGLAIVQRVAEMHGGTVWASSSASGTTVGFSVAEHKGKSET